MNEILAIVDPNVPQVDRERIVTVLQRAFADQITDSPAERPEDIPVTLQAAARGSRLKAAVNAYVKLDYPYWPKQDWVPVGPEERHQGLLEPSDSSSSDSPRRTPDDPACRLHATVLSEVLGEAVLRRMPPLLRSSLGSYPNGPLYVSVEPQSIVGEAHFGPEH